MGAVSRRRALPASLRRAAADARAVDSSAAARRGRAACVSGPRLNPPRAIRTPSFHRSRARSRGLSALLEPFVKQPLVAQERRKALAQIAGIADLAWLEPCRRRTRPPQQRKDDGGQLGRG